MFTGNGWRARWLGRVDRYWDMVAAYGPAAVLLVLAPLGLLFGDYGGVAGILAALLAMLSAGLVTASMLISTAAAPLLRARRDETVDHEKARRLLDEHWSISFFHAPDGSAGALLEATRQRFEALVARTEQPRAAVELLCTERAVTSSAAWQAVKPAMTRMYGREVDVFLVFFVTGLPARLTEQVRRPARFIALMAFASLTVISAMAISVADASQASYGATFLWLFQQWLPGVETAPPTSATGRYFGFMVNVLGWVTLGALLAQLRFVAKFNERLGPAVREDLNHARMRAFTARFGGAFVNYRRKDRHQPVVVSVARALIDKFGKDKVFVDFRSLPPGEPYPDELRANLARCEVLVAVIHPDWHNDLSRWVRFEIATALRMGKKVIPVLLDGATLPPAEELPDDISAIAFRQACRLRQEPFDQYDDLDRLIAAVQHAAGATWP